MHRDHRSRKRKLLALGIMLSLCLLFITLPRPSSTAENENSQVYSAASKIIGDTSGLFLETCSIVSDPGTGKLQWVVAWTSDGSDMIRVEFEPDTLELVHIVDTRTKLPKLQVDLTKVEAERVVMDFVGRLGDEGIFDLPLESEFQGLMTSESDWTFQWLHSIKGIPVWDEFIRIRVDPQSGIIRSFGLKWSEVHVTSFDDMLLSQAEPRPHQHQDITVRTHYQGAFLFPKLDEPSLHEPIWMFDIIGDGTVIGRDFVSIHSGEILHHEKTNYNGIAKLAQGRDSEDNLDPAHTEERTVVSNALQSNNYSATSDTTVWVADLVNDWDTAEIAFFTGHGHGSSGVGSWITCKNNEDFGYDSDTETTDVPSNMSQAIIVYTSSCGGGWTTSAPSMIDRYLSSAALDAGAKAFFGYQGSPYTIQAANYSKYFWAAAMCGKTFASCQAYAGSYYSNSSLGGALASLWGNRSISLVNEDVAYNYFLGEGASGEDIHFEFDDEPCWVDDADWLRYYSYGDDRYMIISVAPGRSDFDVAFKIYDAYSQLIATVDDYGAGSTESYDWTDDQGYYRIRVSVGNGYGGVYDVDVWLMS
ncbi:MAG: hypothetical protein ACFFE7_10855 [Candidatus Thorarchaeota archaeon]